MSHLARELDRQLGWIERQTRELQVAVEQLIIEGKALMNDNGLWNEAQVDTIGRAINEWADNCGRNIDIAHLEATEFRNQLNFARNQG